DCIHLTTNGSLLTPTLSRDLIESGLKDLRFSVYGVDNETYKFNTKRNVDFDKIYKNIREFWELNQLYGSPVKVKTKIMNIYTDEQIKKFREQFLNISSEVTIEGFHKWSASDQWDIEDKNDLIKKMDTDFICAQPFSRLTVLFNGDVTPCCVDWSHKLVVGNIKKHSLDEIWNKLANKLRLDHLSNSINEESPCFDCDYKSKRTKYDKIYDRDGKLSEMFK
ncbi:MAG: SPASM domain-containing protein, partial [Alphaproteobacteria bacterium]